MLGLDGTFNKGKWMYCILVAVTLDANDHTILVAAAVVPIESVITWTWFLQNLHKVCPHFWSTVDPATVFSDRDKSLMKSVSDVMPQASHLYCSWHLGLNAKGYKIRDLLWKCAWSRTTTELDAWLLEVKATSQPGHDWILRIPKQHWVWFVARGKIPN